VSPRPVLLGVGADLQELDGIGVERAAAYALRGVEVDAGLRGVGIAQDANADLVRDEVAGVPVTEGDRDSAGSDVRHVLVDLDRTAEEALRHTNKTFFYRFSKSEDQRRSEDKNPELLTTPGGSRMHIPNAGCSETSHGPRPR
jgi:hypothetical protein